MDALATVRAALVADATVTALVGDRIAALLKEQDIVLPAVTLQRVSLVPQNALGGFNNLDQNSVQVDSWSFTYAQARALATACRNALQTAGFLMTSEFDNSNTDTDPYQYQITQDFQVWTT